MQIEIEKPFLPRTRVMALNSKTKNPKWEPGEVARIETIWNESGTYTHIYTIQLDRESRGGYVIFLTNYSSHVKPSAI